MGGGTEAFEHLGRHCEQEDCHQLDFLPFKCDGCLKVFCVEHRTYKAHACPKADHKSRVVVVCEACSAAIEKKEGSEPDGDTLRRHAQSGDCDPAKKRKPRCPVKGCREQLTFSNTSNCRSCHQKLCLKHRFQDAHTCKPATAAAAAARDKFLLAFAGRTAGGNCSREKHQRTPSPPPIEAC